jgi:hypothetical protein
VDKRSQVFDFVLQLFNRHGPTIFVHTHPHLEKLSVPQEKLQFSWVYKLDRSASQHNVVSEPCHDFAKSG